MAPIYREDAGTSIRRFAGVWIDEEGQPWCKCTPPEPAVQLTVNKEGKNQGKEFWKCDKDRDDEDNCNFFVWEEKVEKLRKQYKLGPEYETPLDPAEIRARASQAAEDRSGGGHRLGGSGSNDRHSPPQTPKKRSHSHRNAASSDEEQPLAGWNSDDDVKLKPISQHKSRKDAGYLATPDVSPEKKKIKREVLEVDLEPEPNPFLDTSADDEDPFHAVLAAVDKAKKERKKFKAQLKARDMRIKGLEEELERVKQGRRA